MSFDQCAVRDTKESDLSPQERQIREMRAESLANWTNRQLELDRMKKLGYYRTRTVTRQQNIKEVHAHG